ncbi:MULTISPECIES: PQQ-dependent sugar dehydrogenase [Gammaproteobacteria]|uniref:PQQ-dependent sugar dehydrogenase n=1 Tax=Gammaproteobacteria TaxID=1236 RepID=UPI001786BCA8|nr:MULTISPECIES: PQQ-dependent sugar dehydrogenase [Gammaproteobacteria]MBD9367969.1 PQQ-dependent sugar dehydrogenase [Xanthomonas sp. XNM01]MBH3343762.1 PQQ-dependent sugar dehydrogenase [Pseudomonas parafulva]
MNLRMLGFAATLSLTLYVGATTPTPANAQATAPAPGGLPFQVKAVGTFESPWAMAFLPDGNMLVTQKQGAMILFDPRTGAKRTLSGTPAVSSRGQGALMDIVPAPDFSASKRVYFSYSEPGSGAGSRVALATATLDQAGGALKETKVIFRAQEASTGGHYSGRIAFSPDGKYLFFTSGDRQLLDPAQDPRSTLGKVLRLNLDGTPAAGNPLAAKGFHAAVWSYGHRNLLGVTFDKEGRLWEMEMGPRHGDEINLIKPALNYGWPRASNGDHYDGRDIPDHAPGDGFEAPKVFWNPAISPGGLAYYDAELFPQWRNSLFITGLSGRSLDRIALDGENATQADHWDMGERIRAVRTGPDGALWLLEDGTSGRMLMLTPKG